MIAPLLLALQTKPVVVRAGHFPNVTHAQAVIAHGLAREGKPWFEPRLGEGVEVQWFVYNAGPSATEAILARSIDLTYVGPNPAINAHARSGGDEIRVVAGACGGGAALVVQSDGRIKSDADFKGKRIATPQLGNTQDVAARAWLKAKGLKITLTGGDARVLPTANPDQLALFASGDLDAVWTVEPWVSRLELEAKGKVYFEEGPRSVTTHLVSSVAFLKEKPDLLKRWIAAHVELTEWIRAHPAEARAIFNREMKAETTRAMSEAVLERAWKRLDLTSDPLRASLLKAADDAFAAGLLPEKPDLSRLYDLRLLDEVLAGRRTEAVR